MKGKLSLSSLIILSIFSYIFLPATCLSPVKAVGTLDFGKACQLNSPDESKQCDSSKRLSCDSASSLCKCHHESRDIYDEETGRCETKVGKVCAADNTFPVICVGDAICNKTTNFCECPSGYEMKPDGSECSGGIHNTESSNVFMSSMAMFLLLISVFICT